MIKIFFNKLLQLLQKKEGKLLVRLRSNKIFANLIKSAFHKNLMNFMKKNV